mmetsp:Transcript_41862/g.129667  ORF Transcript_41862/g.129667 Transcript_41862/m.129667 type:complete len:639 (+) Transcript_41862:148-2064(+)
MPKLLRTGSLTSLGSCDPGSAVKPPRSPTAKDSSLHGLVPGKRSPSAGVLHGGIDWRCQAPGALHVGLGHGLSQSDTSLASKQDTRCNGAGSRASAEAKGLSRPQSALTPLPARCLTKRLHQPEVSSMAEPRPRHPRCVQMGRPAAFSKPALPQHGVDCLVALSSSQGGPSGNSTEQGDGGERRRSKSPRQPSPAPPCQPVSSAQDLLRLLSAATLQADGEHQAPSQEHPRPPKVTLPGLPRREVPSAGPPTPREATPRTPCCEEPSSAKSGSSTSPWLPGARWCGEFGASPGGTPTARRGKLSVLRARRAMQAVLAVEIPAEEEAPTKTIRQLRDNEKIYDLYYWERVIQEDGDGGKVVVCRPKNGPEGVFDYIMKIKSKEKLRHQNYEEQYRTAQLRMLNFPPHAGVVPLTEVLEDKSFYYIVMDKAKGGSFFHSLLHEFKSGVMPTRAVRQLMREILEAVDHLHKQGVLHRDIKPDNLMMQVYDDDASPTGQSRHVVLIDFDHADPEWSPAIPHVDTGIFGTLRFNAPETFLGKYSKESDLYSVGTILYLLMAGKMPYRDEIFEQEPVREASPMSRQSWMDTVYQLMRQEAIDWACSPWPEQPVCRGFCAALLSFDACNRPSSAEEALAHPWLQD